MARFGKIGLLVGTLWLLAAPARAGIYNFAEPRDNLGKDFLSFRATVLNLRDIGNVAQLRRTDPDRPIPGREVKYENPVLQRYLFIGGSSDVERWDRTTTMQRLNLSAYLLRCRREADVRDLLEPLVRKQPDNFLALANLAMAYFYLNELERAVFYQEQALAAWPVRIDELKPEQKKFLERGGWSQIDHEFYRTVEEHFLELLQSRLPAWRRKETEVQTVDPLFKDKAGAPLRFVNTRGEYEPGNLAKSEQDKLPRNSLEIVQQLLLWVPHDNRLYWLYGELLAAQNEIKDAKNIFLQDLENSIHAKEFREHRSVLLRATIPDEPIPTGDGDDKEGAESKRTVKGKRSMTMEEMEKELDRRQTTAPYPYRDMVITFLVGIGVGIFAVWQYREMRRRHQKKPA